MDALIAKQGLATRVDGEAHRLIVRFLDLWKRENVGKFVVVNN